MNDRELLKYLLEQIGKRDFMDIELIQAFSQLKLSMALEDLVTNRGSTARGKLIDEKPWYEGLKNNEA